MKTVTGFRLKLQQMLAGIQQVIPEDSSVGPATNSLAKTDLVSTLTSGLAEYAAVDTAETGLSQARGTLEGDLPGLHTYYANLVLVLKAQFGASSPQLSYFGIIPKTARKPLTPEKAMIRTAKINETRAIRGTESKQQKQSKKFQGTVSVGTTVSASGSSSSTPAEDTAQTAPSAGTVAPAAGGTAPGNPPGNASQVMGRGSESSRLRTPVLSR